MRSSTFAVVLCLAVATCYSAQESADRVVVTTPTGRKEKVTRQYTVNEVEEGAATSKALPNKFDIQHPIYPSKQQTESLKQHLEAKDQIWYFQGLDSGWAIVRQGKVVWLIVTNHEY